MNTYTNKTFDGIWPTGTAAVVIAESNVDAARKLSDELLNIGLAQDINPSEMILLDDGVVILCDGDY